MLSVIFKNNIEKLLAEKRNTTIAIKKIISISGGCINNCYQIQTSDGNFFLKCNDAKKYPRMFEVEAKGLSLLHSTSALKIPEVIIFGEVDEKSFLVLEYIKAGVRHKNFWEDFGAKLAALHKNSSASFGLNYNNYIGSLPQINHLHATWIGFFIEERLERQITFAKKSGSISNTIIQQFKNLFSLLPELIPDERSALLHGDLWNGNYLVAEDGSPCLFDPAVYYGHREMDLAMTRLFGGFPEEFYESYHEAFALSPDFEERVSIYNLYPLMVHANLFGSGYMSQVRSILASF